MDGKKPPARECLGRGTLGEPKLGLVGLVLLRLASGRMELTGLPHRVDHLQKKGALIPLPSFGEEAKSAFMGFYSI